MLSTSGNFIDSFITCKTNCGDTVSNAKLIKNGYVSKNYQKVAVPLPDQKTSQNSTETRKKRNNLDYFFRQPKSNRVSPEIPLIKTRSFSGQTTEDPFKSINFILEEVSSLEKDFSQISSNNNNIHKIMTQFLVQLSETNIRKDDTVKKQNSGMSFVQRQINELNGNIEEQEKDKENFRKKEKAFQEKQGSYIVLYPAGALRKGRTNSNISIASNNAKIPTKPKGILNESRKNQLPPDPGKSSNTKEIQTEHSVQLEKRDKQSQYSTDETGFDTDVTHRTDLKILSSKRRHYKKKSKQSLKKKLAHFHPFSRSIFLEMFMNYIRCRLHSAILSNSCNSSEDTKRSLIVQDTGLEANTPKVINTTFGDSAEDVASIDSNHNKMVPRVLKIMLLQLHILVVLIIILFAEIPNIYFGPFSYLGYFLK